MGLTAAQLQTLKTDLAANTNTVLVNGTPTAINTLAQTANNADAIATQWYNQPATGFFAWQTACPLDALDDAIVWANYTPADAVPIPGGTPTIVDQVAQALWQSRSLCCQGKQLNLQNMLANRTVVNGSKPNLVAGLKDCLQQIPAGANGALKDAGWATVQAALQRGANNIEKLLKASGAGTAGNGAATLTFEGTIQFQDIQSAWAA